MAARDRRVVIEIPVRHELNYRLLNHSRGNLNEDMS